MDDIEDKTVEELEELLENLEQKLVEKLTKVPEECPNCGEEL